LPTSDEAGVTEGDGGREKTPPHCLIRKFPVTELLHHGIMEIRDILLQYRVIFAKIYRK
jgi:hypothetical protein